MATLSSAGIGSGLDVKGIVAQLMAIERRPLQALQQTQRRTDDQLSAYGRMQSALTALRDAAARLGNVETWGATKVASSDASAVVATGNASTPQGSYAVSVGRLAAAQTLSLATPLANADEALGSGSLTIQLGRWNAGSFTPKAGSTAVTLRFDLGQDSLTQVRDRINASGAGVTASIVNDANGARLALRATGLGEANGFRISVNDDDGDNGDVGGLSRLAYDPQNGIGQMQLTQAAANAQATINGVPVSSASNNLDGVLDGLSLQLSKVTTAEVTVSVNRDQESIRKAVTDFATAYNDAVKLMREQTRTADGAGGTGGVLSTDASAKTVLNQLRSLAGGNSGAIPAAFTRLTDVGLEPQRDGTLKVNDKKLDAAMARFDEARTFFTQDLAGTDSDGIGALFRAFGDDRLGANGALSSRQQALRDRAQQLRDRQGVLEDRLAATEKRLTEQYGRLDTRMSSLTSLQNYVTQQIANWNKSSN